MNPDDQPTLPSGPSRPIASGIWQAPTVEALQAMLPQYEILEILGRGGMGAVYKGRQKSLKRLVAIKILPPEAADDEMKFIERFEQEAQTMAAMNHPAIVSVYDFGETADGLLYFIMEYVDGTDVHKMIQASGPLGDDYALAITAHVCDALAYAHSRGVVHRDIKPANILIDQEGRVKVADFGLAKMNDPALTSGLTRSNMAMGTPDYVAPEALAMGMVVDHRADLYAVGVMLYQMLTGEVPRGLFKLPSQKGLGCDPRFDEIICKAMEADREERYQSAMDVRHALDEILTTPQPKDDGTGVVPVKAERSAGAPGRGEPPAKAAVGSVRAPVKKAPSAAIWLSLSGIAVVLGVGGYLVFGGKSKSDPAAGNPGAVSPAPLAAQDCLKFPWEAPWVLSNGVLACPKATVRYLGEGLDGTMRVRFRHVADAAISPNEPPLQFGFRRGAKGTPEEVQSYYQLQIYPSRRTTNLISLWKDQTTNQGGNTVMWRNRPFPPPPEGSNEMELELRASGPEISLWSGATEVASIQDDRAQSGNLVIIAGPGVEITALETRDYDTTKANPPQVVQPKAVEAKSDAPQNITDWKDVTETVGEELRAKQGFTVGPEGIARSSEGETVYTPLLDGRVGDRAVRVHYIGQTQISLWFAGGGGSAFVLAQRDRVMFKRQREEEGEADTLLPSVMHPAGFDATQPHELLVAVQGATVRAWLDGRFVGEAEEALFQQSAIRLVPIAESTVQKVEVATMVASHASVTGAKGDDRPNHNRTSPEWSDWLGPKLASGQSLPAGWKVDGSGVTTEKPMGGTNVIQQEVKDAAVRVSYDLRDSQGIQITMRESKPGGSRDMYFVDDTGDSIYVARLKGTEVETLTRQDYPPGTPRTGMRSLEFRCVGVRLEATVTGATSEPITLSATDSALVSGPCAVVLKKNVLLKKVEVAELIASLASEQSPSSTLTPTFNDHRYQFVSGNFTWQEARTQAEQLGGHLAVITSGEENDWAWKTFSNQLPPQPADKVWTRGWWLGASQTSLEKPWQWITRDSLEFTMWGRK